MPFWIRVVGWCHSMLACPTHQLHDLLCNDRPDRGCRPVRDSDAGCEYPRATPAGAQENAIAASILAISTLAGGPLLGQLGVFHNALQTAGGIILLVIAIEMVFARPTSAFRLTPPEGVEAQTKRRLS